MHALSDSRVKLSITLGLQQRVKQVSDECENKSKQVSELQKTLECSQLSLSSNEAAKQVNMILHVVYIIQRITVTMLW